MDRATRSWAAREARRHPELLRLGYFGSYARGDAGVGSDLDVIAIVREAAEPFERRSLIWDLNPLPVPAEIIIYTLPAQAGIQVLKWFFSILSILGMKSGNCLDF